MSQVEVGKKVPDFSLPANGGDTFTLSGLKKKKLVIYFYPKDNTPGCTNEAQDFRDLYPEFASAGAEVVGVSRDSVKTHDNFVAKLHLPFRLLSDADETVCKLFGVLKQKLMYGRKVWGIERSTFLIDEKGVLRQEWRKVRVTGHAQEVLTAVRDL
jgi:peroxiredoxin Q/BCP